MVPVLLPGIFAFYCTIALPVLQGLRPLGPGFQGRRQLPLGGLGRPLLRPGQFAHQDPDGIPDLLQQGPVVLLAANELVQ